MKIHTDIVQGSVQWLEMRAGKVTASEADRLVSPLGKVRTGDGPHTFMLEKLAEKWTGAPLPSDASSFAMEQGTILEEFARPAFAVETGLTVIQVGFIESDDGRCGCSPDGVVEDQLIGLEIKSPGIVNHLRYLLDGGIPSDYILQVQFSLYVTEFDAWKFTSFKRGMCPLIVTVEPDEKIQASIRTALEVFNEELDAAWQQLCRLNGGPPPPRPVFTPSPEPIKFSWEQTTDRENGLTP